MRRLGSNSLSIVGNCRDRVVDSDESFQRGIVGGAIMCNGT
jgi:hypothetical protein